MKYENLYILVPLLNVDSFKYAMWMAKSMAMLDGVAKTKKFMWFMAWNENLFIYLFYFRGPKQIMPQTLWSTSGLLDFFPIWGSIVSSYFHDRIVD